MAHEPTHMPAGSAEPIRLEYRNVTMRFAAGHRRGGAGAVQPFSLPS